MKQLLALIVASILSVLSTANLASAQWFQHTQVFGGNITSFAVIEPKLFAASDNGGVFSSSDNGRSWNECNTGLTDHVVRCLASSGSMLYAGTNAGIFYSSDQGINWQPTIMKVPGDTVTALLVTGTAVIVGVRDSGIYTSYDNGVHWQHTLISSNNEVFEFSRYGSSIFVATFGGAAISVNDGLSWQSLKISPYSQYITSIAAFDTVIIASSYVWGGFRSADMGKHWTKFNFPGNSSTPDNSIVIKGAFVYVRASYDGCYFSSNAGVTWTKANGGLHDGVTTGLFLYDSTVFIGTRSGIYRTKVGDTIWEAVKIALPSADIYKLTTNGLVMFAGMRLGGLLCSTDEGGSWSSATPDMRISTVNEIAVQGKYVFAATDSAGLFRSSDAGSTWHQLDVGQKICATGVFANGTTVYLGTDTKLFRSDDFGVHWVIINSTFAKAKTFAALGSCLFAGTDHGYYRSQDSGITWSRTNTTVSGFPEFNNALTIGDDLFAAAGSTMFLTSDQGETWKQATHVLPAYATVRSLQWDGRYLYAGTDMGFYQSSDYGKNWRFHNEGLRDEHIIRALLIRGLIIYAGLEKYGLWMRPLTELGVSENKAEDIQRTIVYPNPTTGVVSFTSPIKHITILSSIGQVVFQEEVVEGQQSVDISKLTSGIYLAQLKTANSISTVKIIKQ